MGRSTARVGDGVAPGDLDRDVVVGAGVGDAAADDALGLVDEHRLAGGRAEIDSEEDLNARTSVGRDAPRRAASICR